MSSSNNAGDPVWAYPYWSIIPPARTDTIAPRVGMCSCGRLDCQICGVGDWRPTPMSTHYHFHPAPTPEVEELREEVKRLAREVERLKKRRSR